MNSIALSINPVAIIGGSALVLLGFYFLLWAFNRMLRNVDNMRDQQDKIYYEEWEASDGKKYYWPENHPRSSRKEEE